MPEGTTTPIKGTWPKKAAEPETIKVTAIALQNGRTVYVRGEETYVGQNILVVEGENGPVKFNWSAVAYYLTADEPVPTEAEIEAYEAKLKAEARLTNNITVNNVEEAIAVLQEDRGGYL